MKTALLIKQIFDTYFEAPIDAWQSFVDFGEVITTQKEELIKRGGNIETYLYFILKGSGGVMLWNNNNYVCVDLCYEGEFFGDYMSFITQQPTPIEIITFESSEVFRISKTNFDKLTQNDAFGEKICRFASEALFVHKQMQQIDIITKTPTQRYHDLLKKQAQVVQRTPQKHIASYLGITPQSLSRIRAKIV
jgi:CRP-like cAMP-binding protein